MMSFCVLLTRPDQDTARLQEGSQLAQAPLLHSCANVDTIETNARLAKFAVNLQPIAVNNLDWR
jgi:hypothetical protein